MGDKWNGEGYDQRMGESSKGDEQVPGRATEADEFDDVTEDQDEDEDQDEADIDDEEDGTF